MRPLKYSIELLQEILVHATERAQKVAHARPDAFDGGGMDFADTIAVIIMRPLAVSRSMADGLLASTGLG
jgi:hypothetical protein